MTMNVFAKKGYKVELYNVTIDEKLIKNIQSKIDTWNGKGEIKEVKTDVLLECGYLDKKIEVISQEYVGKGCLTDYFCPSLETVNIYNFKFYEYTQHPLSKLCDTILEDYQPLDLSEHIVKLINWTTEDNEEISFVKQLLSAFRFEKLNIKKEVKKRIEKMENFNSGFYGSELNGKDFKYNLVQKKIIKRKILSNLPNVNKITKL